MSWATVAPSDHAGLLALYEGHFAKYEVSGDQRARCRAGLRLLLAWLQPVGGQLWQQAWDNRVEAEGAWTGLVAGLRQSERTCLYKAVQILLAYHVVRPSYPWLLQHSVGDIYHFLFEATERQAHQRLVEAAREIGFGANTLASAWAFVGRILIHTGKALDEIDTADLLELRTQARGVHGVATGHFSVTRLLFHLGIVTEPLLSPSYFRAPRPTVDQIIDRFGVRTSSARDAFVLYLKEREPALDHNSLRGLADRLLRLFWCDIEAHHDEVCSLALPAAVAEAWRARTRVLPDGRPRAGVEAVFFAVRAFYLDLQQWATTDPTTWAHYVNPSPVRDSDLSSLRKSVLQQRARTHARIRRMQPLLARFVAHVRERRDAAASLLAAAYACRPGESFECGGIAFRRQPNHLSAADRRADAIEPVTVRRVDAPSGAWLNCRLVEDRAFWTWAVTEILRLTGLRCEELIELTHVSIRRHRMADDREVLLLQIAPSKQDRERVIPVCPELAHALARVVERTRGRAPRIPCIPRNRCAAPIPFPGRPQAAARRILPRKHPPTSAGRKHRCGPGGQGRYPGRFSAARFPSPLGDRSRQQRSAVAHCCQATWPRRPEHHQGIRGGIRGRGRSPVPGAPRPQTGVPAGPRISRADDRRVGGVRAALPSPPDGAWGLLPALRHRLPTRARLHTLLAATRGHRATAALAGDRG